MALSRGAELARMQTVVHDVGWWVGNRPTAMKWKLAVICVVLARLFSESALGAADRVFAFADVTVVPMGRPGELAHQTVLTRGDRIVAMGPAATIRIPKGATRVDGVGRYLMPGLIDMHVHFMRRPLESDDESWKFPDYAELNERFGALYVINGVTSVRQLHAHPAGDELVARSFGPDWLGPAIYSSGPITDGDPPEWPVARVVRTSEEARRAVREDKAAGYAEFKVYDFLPSPLYAAIVDEAAKSRIDVVGHVPDAVGLQAAIDANQLTIEHIDSFVTSLQPGNQPYQPPSKELKWRDQFLRADPSALAPFADQMRVHGIWTCPTIVVYESDATGAAQVPEMRYVPAAATAKLVARYGERPLSVDQEVRFGLEVVSILHEHGAGLLLGSDVFKLNVVPGFSALKELDYLVRAGLSPYEALQTGTVNAARVLHQEDELGTVDVGKRADLLLLRADPLTDVHHVSARAGVMLRGRWLSAQELEVRLASYLSQGSR